MSASNIDEFFFEKKARRDYLFWMALVAGFALIVVVFAIRWDPGSPDMPAWMQPIPVILGTGMAVLAGYGLVFNTSRGCKIDPITKELVWWQMKFPSQTTQGKYRIKISDIAMVRIGAEDDPLRVSLYDKNGRKQESFSESVLPADYNQWLTKFAQAFPHVQIIRQ